MIKPKKIKKGDTIGIPFPASGTSKEEVIQMVELIESLGFKVKLGRSAYEKYGYLSGDDKIRAQDINEMFLDPDVNGILCGRGGYGSPRILDSIDYDIVRENPKVFIGYSDITALHIAFNQKCKLVTFHGPMGTSDMIHSFRDETRLSMKEAVMNQTSTRELKNFQGKIEFLRPGSAQGKIIGGNLSLIADTMGTEYEIDTKDKILFIEEIEEEPRKIDRMLNQLRLAGLYDKASAIILGNFNNCIAERENSLSLDQVFDDFFANLKIPVIKNFQAGHCEPAITIPLGVDVKIDGDKEKIILLENAVE